MDRAHIICNKNGIPFDTAKPSITSGIRLGTPAGTTRGFTGEDFRDIGEMIADVLDGLTINGGDGNNEAIENVVKEKVIKMCNEHPIYKYML